MAFASVGFSFTAQEKGRQALNAVIKVMQAFALIVIMFGIQILSFLPAKTDHLKPPLK